jgi:UDP-sugar transporter A1/2/3
LSQLKIVSTSVLSVVLLSKRIDASKWRAILILVIGVVIVATSSSKAKSGISQVIVATTTQLGNDMIGSMRTEQRSRIIDLYQGITRDAFKLDQERFVFLSGVIALIFASILGGASSVYVEMKVKSELNLSLWVRNIQLALFSILPALAAVFYEAFHKGLYSQVQGFDRLAWAVVLSRVVGGFIVALVLKYCDSILKGEWISLK